jgi:hypothetical protein
MIQVTFENDQIGLREMEEQIRSFVVKIPERISRAPERVLLIDPFPFLLVLLNETRFRLP